MSTATEGVIEGFEIAEILSHLPHRYPFLLVDRVLSYDATTLQAIKNVTMNEPFFQGHFPGKPIMPGVLILEAMAQACVLLAQKSIADSANTLYLFAGLDKVRFKRPVTPGDQLLLNVEFISRKRNIWRMYGEASVNGQLACSGNFISAGQEISK